MFATLNPEAAVPEPQLSLFRTDDAGELARACLDLAWDIIQRRRQLTEPGVAHLWGELALVRERLDGVTHAAVAQVPAIAELRARQRARERPADAPVHYPDARPAWAKRVRRP